MKKRFRQFIASVFVILFIIIPCKAQNIDIDQFFPEETKVNFIPSFAINQSKIEFQDYEKDNDYLFWLEKYEKYPVATYIWLYLTKTLNYSEIIAAGLIGNFMVETGGGTLDIQWNIYSKTKYYYGICQWNKKNYKEIHGKNLEEQCQYLAKTIEYELNSFGSNYAKGYKYKDFLKLDSEKKIALMFAKCYERCGSGTYKKRQSCATKAYEYFIN